MKGFLYTFTVFILKYERTYIGNGYDSTRRLWNERRSGRISPEEFEWPALYKESMSSFGSIYNSSHLSNAKETLLTTNKEKSEEELTLLQEIAKMQLEDGTPQMNEDSSGDCAAEIQQVIPSKPHDETLDPFEEYSVPSNSHQDYANDSASVASESSECSSMLNSDWITEDMIEASEDTSATKNAPQHPGNFSV